MTRRQFHGALASAGLAVVAAPILGRGAHAANTDPAALMNFTWGGYVNPDLCMPYVE
jgi:spermidine/putrescine-binding protein